MIFQRDAVGCSIGCSFYICCALSTAHGQCEKFQKNSMAESIALPNARKSKNQNQRKHVILDGYRYERMKGKGRDGVERWQCALTTCNVSVHVHQGYVTEVNLSREDLRKSHGHDPNSDEHSKSLTDLSSDGDGALA